MHWLKGHGMDCKNIEVIADKTAFEEMIPLSGRELVLVTDIRGKVLPDFNPQQFDEVLGKASMSRMTQIIKICTAFVSSAKIRPSCGHLLLICVQLC
jgi:hypothetical protein